MPIDSRLQRIDHFVVLLMENRSFDHCLGYLSLKAGRGDVNGLIGNESNPWETKRVPVTAAGLRNVETDPPHGAPAQVEQRGNNDNSGFIRAYMKAEGHKPQARPDDVMLYYDEQMLPAFDFFAREFCVCDAWHAAIPGPTWPNRMYAFAGTSMGRLTNDLPDAPGLQFPTIFDILSGQGVDWRFFESDVASVRMFASHLGDRTRIKYYDDPQFGFAALAKAGQLPPVTYIDPNFTSIPGLSSNDDHPPRNPIYGQALAAEIYKILRSSPKWTRTALIITYDEHGGFYDHVQPPAAADDVIRSRGFRVPAFVISPWSGRGAVRSEVYDHTSILRTILNRFVDPAAKMSTRVDAAKDLSLAFSEPSARATKPMPTFDIASRLVHTHVPKDAGGEPTDIAADLAELRRRRDAAFALKGLVA